MKVSLVFTTLIFANVVFAQTQTLTVKNDQVKAVRMEITYKAPLLDSNNVPVCHVNRFFTRNIDPDIVGNASVFKYDLIREFTVKDCDYKLQVVTIILFDALTNKEQHISFIQDNGSNIIAENNQTITCQRRERDSLSGEGLIFACKTSKDQYPLLSVDFLKPNPLPEIINMKYLPEQINPRTPENLAASIGKKNIKVEFYKNKFGVIGANSPVKIFGIPELAIKDLVIIFNSFQRESNQVPTSMEVDSQDSNSVYVFLEIYPYKPEYKLCPKDTGLLIQDVRDTNNIKRYCVI
jgi:hypothetical protein